MFDSYYLQERQTEYVTKSINVTEKKAPTDESIKLLNEFSEKALENIVKRFSTSNNTFFCTGAVFYNPMKASNEVHIKYTLNSKDYTFCVELNEWESNTQRSVAQKLYEKICDKLAEQIMLPLLEDFSRIKYL